VKTRFILLALALLVAAGAYAQSVQRVKDYGDPGMFSRVFRFVELNDGYDDSVLVVFPQEMGYVQIECKDLDVTIWRNSADGYWLASDDSVWSRSIDSVWASAGNTVYLTPHCDSLVLRTTGRESNASGLSGGIQVIAYPD
jgi:hypothetical protein